ncbi:MAG: oligosaccharide flippase family protein [Coriobacteriales bacterium]|nr:oligosaccharide flippase family protein [Coriobacteriales bacterium]
MSDRADSAQMPETPSDAQPPAKARVSVLGGTVATGAAMVFRQAANFVISILIARGLGPTGKGEIALLQQYAGVAALIMGLGFEGAHAYFVGRRGRRPAEAIADSLLFVAAISLVGVPAVWAIVRYLVPALKGVPGPVLVVASLAVVPMLLAGLVSGVLIGEGRVRSQAFATASASVVPLALIGFAAATGRLTVFWAISATVAGLALSAIVALIATRAGKLPSPSWRRMREEISYAWRSYVQNVAGYLELRQDVLLLGILSSSAAVGVYTTGVSFSELIYFVPQTVMVALTARSFQEEPESGAELTMRVTRLLIAFSFVLTAGLALIVRPLIALAFGPEFVNASIVFALLVPGILSWALSSQLQAYLATHGRLFPGLGAIALALNLTLNLVLIPRFGMYGAAVATSISYSFGNGYVTWVFLKSTEGRLRDLLIPHREDFRLLRVSAGAFLGRRG